MLTFLTLLAAWPSPAREIQVEVFADTPKAHFRIDPAQTEMNVTVKTRFRSLEPRRTRLTADGRIELPEGDAFVSICTDGFRCAEFAVPEDDPRRIVVTSVTFPGSEDIADYVPGYQHPDTNLEVRLNLSAHRGYLVRVTRLYDNGHPPRIRLAKSDDAITFENLEKGTYVAEVIADCNLSFADQNGVPAHCEDLPIIVASEVVKLWRSRTLRFLE